MRYTRQQMFMEMARAASRRATCYRRAVGCVLVYVDQVVSIGYNGARSGDPHCQGHLCPYFEPSGCTVPHAEANAFDRLPSTLRVCGLDVYTTDSPCMACAERIIEWECRTVYFQNEYRHTHPIEALVSTGIDVFQVLASGWMIDKKNGELVQG